MYLHSYLRIPRDIAKRTDISATAKLVVAALHGRAWGDKTLAWPSIATIAKDIGASETAVKDAIRSLREHGIIRVEARRNPENPRQNLSNVYLLECEGAESDPPQSESNPLPGAKSVQEIDNLKVEERNNQIPASPPYICDSSFVEGEDEFMKTLRAKLRRQAKEQRDRELADAFEDYLASTACQ